MPASIYHVRKISLGLQRKYRISADDGDGRAGKLLGYAEKKLKTSDELDVYGDEQRGERLVAVRESSKGRLAALTGYEAFDPEGRLDFTRDGEPVFSIDKPKVFDDWYRLTVHEDAVDRRLLFALAVTMEARQRG